MSTTKTTTTKINSKATSSRSSKPEVPSQSQDSRKSTNISDGNSNRTAKPAGSGAPKPADGAPRPSRSPATKVEDKSRTGKSIVDPAGSKANNKTTTTKINSKATSSRSSKPEVPSQSQDSRKSTNISDGNSNRTAKPAGSGAPKPTDGALRPPRSPATKVEDKSRTGKSIVDPAGSKANNKAPTTKSTSKTHPSHPKHVLEKENRTYPFKCDGCKIRCVGERYACAPCKYNLHVDCISASPRIKFQGQKCQFLERPLRCGAPNCHHGDYCRSCNACGMTVKGFVYHCKEMNTDFHPSCTKLKNEIRIEDVIFRLEKKGSSKCLRCQRKKLEGSSKDIPGWSYVSNHKGYTFHVHCLMDMAMQCSPKTNKGASSSASSSSSPSSTSALNNLSIPQINSSKFKDSMGSNSLKMLEVFLKIVLPLLMGAHPATFVVSLAALGVKELVNLIFQD